MAANYRTSKYRTTSLSERDKSGFYVYGNTVRQAETLPRKTKSPYSQQREQTKRTSSRVVKNRNRAMSISPAYAVFLTAAAVCAVLICVPAARHAVPDRLSYPASLRSSFAMV